MNRKPDSNKGAKDQIISMSFAEYLAILERIERLKMALEVYAEKEDKPNAASQALAHEERQAKRRTLDPQ